MTARDGGQDEPFEELVDALRRLREELREELPELEAEGREASAELRDLLPDGVDVLKRANKFLYALAGRTARVELLDDLLPRLEAARDAAPGPAGEARDDDQAVLDAQEEERRRTSVRIHDGPAQLLANGMMRLEFCERLVGKDPAKAGRELRDVREELEGVLAEIRRLIFDLRPMTLDDLGLLPTLQRLVENEKQRAPYSLQLIVRGPFQRFDPSAETHMYRIVQEGLWNAAEHGEPDDVRIRVRIDPGKEVLLVVEDDGAGFDPEEVGAGNGMAEIRRRVAALGGAVEWTSNPGEGCRLEVRVPLGGPPA